MSGRFKVGVVGATGAVGSTILDVLAERDFPASEVVPFASERSAGKRVGKVSVVGAGMRSHPGIAAKVFETLGQNGINIEMIATSPIKISCVIDAERVPDAVRALHQAFELGADAVRPEEPTGTEHRPIVPPEAEGSAAAA